jgi:hypothetical protein
MKKVITVWIIVLTAASIIAQTSKTTSKPKPKTKTAQVIKQKPAVQPGDQPIPENAYYYKESGKQDGVIDSKYPAIVIEGSNNRINIADGNTMIFVKGKKNDINMISADYIEITGDDNFVSWQVSNNASGKPVIKDKGGYNNVGKRTTGALNKSEN